MIWIVESLHLSIEPSGTRSAVSHVEVEITGLSNQSSFTGEKGV